MLGLRCLDQKAGLSQCTRALILMGNDAKIYPPVINYHYCYCCSLVSFFISVVGGVFQVATFRFIFSQIAEDICMKF